LQIEGAHDAPVCQGSEAAPYRVCFLPLAVSYASSGKLKQAEETAHRALEPALSAENYPLCEYIRSQIELYNQAK